MSEINGLPDFSSFPYRIANAPTGAKLRAWSKLRECERRLAFYRWVKGLEEVKTRYRKLLDDAVSAFLLSFEATLQFVKDQFIEVGAPDFDKWIKGLAEHDLIVRGLRTLRHFEAHVEEKPTGTTVRRQISEHLPSGRSETSGGQTYHLSVLTSTELKRLKKSRPLKEPDLNDWNAHVQALDVGSVFESGLHQLKKILDQAEAVI